MEVKGITEVKEEAGIMKIVVRADMLTGIIEESMDGEKDMIEAMAVDTGATSGNQTHNKKASR
jgi:hypothetical protein